MTLDASEAFYAKLGFMREASHEGCKIHLTIAVEGGLIPGRNPFGLYTLSRERRWAGSITRRSCGARTGEQALGDVRIRVLRSR
jgi:hypothetical protein